MNPFTLERIQTLPVGIDQAWDFFSDPGNLASAHAGRPAEVLHAEIAAGWQVSFRD